MLAGWHAEGLACTAEWGRGSLLHALQAQGCHQGSHVYPTPTYPAPPLQPTHTLLHKCQATPTCSDHRAMGFCSQARLVSWALRAVGACRDGSLE